MPIALDILFPIPTPAFSYLLPFDADIPSIGVRVVVPWQQGLRIGLLVGVREVGASLGLELKQIITVLDSQPFILPKQTEFILELAQSSCSPAGLVLSTLLATGLNEELIHEARAIEGIKDISISTEHWVLASQLDNINLFREQGLIKEQIRIVPIKHKVLKIAKPIDENLQGKRQLNQKIALEWLESIESVASGSELARQAGVSESAVRTLVKKGYIKYVEEDAPEPALPSYPSYEINKEISFLSDADYIVISGGSKEERIAALYDGIARALANDRSVLIIAPEQSLIAETASYLQGKFPTLVLSGELNDRQRKRLWHELEEQAVVLVASYFGFLAPLHKLGQIILIEESSSSHKLRSGPRLFSPSVAKALAKKINCPIILTDSLISAESLLLTKEANAEHLQLSYLEQRYYFSDMSSSNNWPLSANLLQVLNQVKDRSRQAILLSPRRGYSAALGCTSCGEIISCPNCDLSLKYYQEQKKLRCHQCSTELNIPKICSNCNSYELQAMRGAGTEWILKTVKRQIPGIPVYRYDSDQRDDLSAMLAGEAGVVVATSAILRHKPLSNVSLIALTLFDSLLAFSDYRAEEEALRTVLSLNELAPKKRPLILLQSFQLEHKLFKILRASDKLKAINSFLEELLIRRKAYNYPPYSKIARIQISAKDEQIAYHESNRIFNTLKIHCKEHAHLLGPSQMAIFRIRNFYNYQIFISDLSSKGFDELLKPIIPYRGQARVRIDIEPREIGGFLE